MNMQVTIGISPHMNTTTTAAQAAAIAAAAADIAGGRLDAALAAAFDAIGCDPHTVAQAARSVARHQYLAASARADLATALAALKLQENIT